MPAAGNTPIVIGLLGPVTVDGREIPGPRAKRLLVALALADGRSVSAARLIDEVWGRRPPKSPSAALHTQISRLRGLVGDAVQGGGGRYRLTGTVTDLDLAVQRAAAGDAEAALALWRGVPGDDVPGGDLAQELSDRAAAARRRVDEAIAAAALDAGEFAVAEEIGRRKVAADPLDEPASLLLMRALAGLGRRAEALAVFARLRRTLAAELGVDPGPQATALNAELLTLPAAATTRPSPRVAVPGARLRDMGNDLVGRDDDLTAIVELLGRRRVVTVLGPGGVGKTRIANAVGRELAGRGEAVCFVPLAAVRSGEDLVAAVASALGVGEPELTTSGRPRIPSGSLADRLADALGGTDTVVILDNCEQVIDSCAALVDALIAAAPGVGVLTTSRTPLLIPAEQVYPLAVLDVDGVDSAAARLFVQRARAVRPDIESPPAAVAALCRRLDGLPLAIELAAARVRTMSVEDIAARIAERFELLRSVDRTAPDRHRTLYAVIDWSWTLLASEPRQALTRLCLFPGGVSREAAAQVTGLSGVALDDVLAALVDQSLLQVDESGGHTRFRMLEMVREFGEQRLAESASGGSPSVESVVLEMQAWAREYCREIQRQYDRRTDRALVGEVDREAENLVWVLRRSVSGRPVSAGDRCAAWPTIIAVFPVLSGFWSSRGLHAEVQAWGERILEVLPPPPDGLDAEDRAAWQWTLIAVALHLFPQRRLRPLGRARTSLRRLARPERRFVEVTEFLTALILCGSAGELHRTLIRGARPGHPDGVRAIALGLLFNLKENGGDIAGALRVSERFTQIPTRPDSFVAAMGEMATASLHSQQGRGVGGLDLYRSARRRFQELGADDDARQVTGYVIAGLLQSGDLAGARAELDGVGLTWTPGAPLPPGNPESMGVILLVEAEYRRLTGRESIAWYTAASDTLLAGHPLATRDPGAAMILAAAAAGLLLVDCADRAADLVESLVASTITSGADPVWLDVPQVGGVALVCGALRCRNRPADESGTGLLVLSETLHARRDYPAMAELAANRRLLSGADDDRWRQATGEFGGLGRRRALTETMRLFTETMRLLGEGTTG